MSHNSSRLTVPAPKLFYPFSSKIHHFSLSLQKQCALRYVLPFNTSHFPSAITVLSVMSHHSSRPAALPPKLCSPLCPNIYHVSLSLYQHWALHYVPTYYTPHCPSTKSVLTVMSHHSSSHTSPPKTLCSPLCPTIHQVSLLLQKQCSPLCPIIHHVSLPLHQNCDLRYAPPIITSHCPSKKSALRYVPQLITSHRPPQTLCSPLCPNLLYASLPFHQVCALRYVPPFILSHFPTNNTVFSVMPHNSSGLNAPPKTVL